MLKTGFWPLSFPFCFVRGMNNGSQQKQLADIFGASIRTIQNWQEQGMPVLRGGGKGNEVLYDSAAVIKWYAERDAEIENEKLRREVEELRLASEADLHPEHLNLSAIA